MEKRRGTRKTIPSSPWKTTISLIQKYWKGLDEKALEHPVRATTGHNIFRKDSSPLKKQERAVID